MLSKHYKNTSMVQKFKIFVNFLKKKLDIFECFLSAARRLLTNKMLELLT